jgi:alpha-mannosidase
VKSEQATYEVQYGHVQRPTHANTSWDMAKFEVPAQRWADLSQPDYGVALLNDCKYGYAVHDSVMSMSLLRSQKHPDAVADMGQHEFTYSLLPHEGDHVAAGVVRAGCQLNAPLRAMATGAHRGRLPADYSAIEVNKDNVVVEVVKKAEDGRDLIVRLYECNGADAVARVKFGFAVKSVSVVDMMEEQPREVACRNNAARLAFKPFEIKTVRVTGGVGGP